MSGIRSSRQRATQNPSATSGLTFPTGSAPTACPLSLLELPRQRLERPRLAFRLLASTPCLQRNLTPSPAGLMDRHTLTSVRSRDKATTVFALFLESGPPGSQGTKLRLVSGLLSWVFLRTSLSSAHTPGRAQARED